MYTEEWVENGIVTEVNNGLANVTVTESDFCEECSAKIFCHTDSNARNVTAKDPYGVKAGDKVRISIKGRSVVAVSFLLYGLPLVLLITGIFVGMNYFKDNSEVLSSAAGIAFVGIYFFAIHFISNLNRRKNKFLPKIIFVSQEKSHHSV